MAITFTAEEEKALQEIRFFFVKAAILQKTDMLLAEVRDTLKQTLHATQMFFPPAVDVQMGKIYRGENYLGLPYMVLDYPKYFFREAACTFRTMLWWGNFFSFTMHLAGEEILSYFFQIKDFAHLRNQDVFLCVHPSPWHYHYQEDNYRPIEQFTDVNIRQRVETHLFLKLSRKISLADYSRLPLFCRESFLLFTKGIFYSIEQ